MRKVIFLDIDGVINTKEWHSKMTKDTPKDEYGYAFDPVAVADLAHIIDETGADMVISSSWKFYGVPKLREMWEIRKLPGHILDINTVSDEMTKKVFNDYDDLFKIACKLIKFFTIETYY
jgi:hypothetical protein